MSYDMEKTWQTMSSGFHILVWRQNKGFKADFSKATIVFFVSAEAENKVQSKKTDSSLVAELFDKLDNISRMSGM